MFRRSLIVGALAFVLLGVTAAPAAAHASLSDSTPANGAQLERAPSRIVLTFTERVEVALGGVRVFDRGGTRVDKGAISHPDGDGARVALALPKLDDGGYVVTWRVVSSDSHPVQGAFTFAIGDAAPANADDVAGLLGDRGGSRAVGVLYGIGRAVAFAAMLVFLGVVAFVTALWPAGARLASTRRVVWAAFVALVVATVANVFLQGGYAAGLGLGDTFSPSVFGDVLRTQFGRAYAARLALLALAAVLLRVAARPAWWKWAALVVGVGVAATPGFAGHAYVGSHQPFALIADVIHVSAASVWLGGIVAMLVLAPSERDLAGRFSRVALGSVAVIVATGLFQAYRQVGSIPALRSTEYGKLLVVKTLLVAAVLCIGYVSRRAAQRWDTGSARTLRRTVAVEAALALCVLGVTGLLVNAVPARVVAAAPQSGELASATLLVDYTVSPGRAGPNDIHLYTLTKAGLPQTVAEMTLQLSLPDKDVAPIDVELVTAGPGHFQAIGFDIPFAGRWTMVITARTSDIDSEVFEGGVQIK